MKVEVSTARTWLLNPGGGFTFYPFGIFILNSGGVTDIIIHFMNQQLKIKLTPRAVIARQVAEELMEQSGEYKYNIGSWTGNIEDDMATFASIKEASITAWFDSVDKPMQGKP